MARGKKTGGKDFQQGKDARRNEDGRPKVDIRVGELKGGLRLDFLEILKEYADLPQSKVQELSKDPELPLLKRMALKFWAEAGNKGDPARLAFFTKTVGLDVNEHNVNVSGTLESLVVGSQKEDE